MGSDQIKRLYRAGSALTKKRGELIASLEYRVAALAALVILQVIYHDNGSKLDGSIQILRTHSLFW
jgi:hypothetical protein